MSHLHEEVGAFDLGGHDAGGPGVRQGLSLSLGGGVGVGGAGAEGQVGGAGGGREGGGGGVGGSVECGAGGARVFILPVAALVLYYSTTPLLHTFHTSPPCSSPIVPPP